MVEWWEAMSLVEQIFAAIAIAATALLVIQVILLIVGAASGGGDMDAGDTGTDFDTSGGSGPDADFDVGNGSAPDAGFDIGDGSGVDVGGVDASGADMGGMDTGFGDAMGADVHIPDVHVDVHMGADMPGVHPHPGDWYGDSGVYDAHLTDTASSGLHMFTLQGLVAFFTVFGWSGLVMLESGWTTGLCIALAVAFGLLAMFMMALAFRAMLRLQQDGTLDIRNALGKAGTVYLKIPAKREYGGKVSLLVQDRLMEMDAVTDEDKPIKTGEEITVVGISGNRSLIVRRK